MRLGYEISEPSVLAMLEQLPWSWTVSVVDTFHTLIYTLASACLAASYTCGTHEAWLGYVLLVILLQVDCGHVMLWLGRYKQVLLWTWQQSLSWHSECWFLLLWKLPLYKVGCHNNTQWHFSSQTSFPGHGMEFGKHSHTGSQVWETGPRFWGQKM